MANINFDDFEREIQQAESYLKSAGNSAPPDTISHHADITPPKPHEEDTLYFASDLKSNAYDTYSAGEMHRFGLTSSAPSSNNMYYADAEMDTMHFGATTDSLDNHNHDQNTLFYASDVVSSNPRQYQHGLDTTRDQTEEEVLSFLPSPQITPRPDPSYDDSFGASMAETVRFTKPSESALRSVDGNNYGNRPIHTNTKLTSATAAALDRRQSSRSQGLLLDGDVNDRSKPRSSSASRSSAGRNRTPTRHDRNDGKSLYICCTVPFECKYSQLIIPYYCLISQPGQRPTRPTPRLVRRLLHLLLLSTSLCVRPTCQRPSAQESPHRPFRWSESRNCSGSGSSQSKKC